MGDELDAPDAHIAPGDDSEVVDIGVKQDTQALHDDDDHEVVHGHTGYAAPPPPVSLREGSFATATAPDAVPVAVAPPQVQEVKTTSTSQAPQTQAPHAQPVQQHMERRGRRRAPEKGHPVGDE